MSCDVMRASQAHQMPHSTRPQMLPVARLTSVNMVPTSTAETASESQAKFFLIRNAMLATTATA